MRLFGKYENIITDLYDFSRIYSKAISGTNLKPISDIMIEKWGSVSNNYKHSFGSHLKYKNKIFWAGLAFNRKSKAVCFILQFKPGAKSLSQKRSLNIAMENDTFTTLISLAEALKIETYRLFIPLSISDNEVTQTVIKDLSQDLQKIRKDFDTLFDTALKSMGSEG